MLIDESVNEYYRFKRVKTESGYVNPIRIHISFISRSSVIILESFDINKAGRKQRYSGMEWYK